MVRVDVDWPAFLGRLDPVWERLPGDWWEAPFLGNGMMGTQIRQTGPQAMQWDIGRSDVQGHDPKGGAVYGLARLPIGYFTLDTAGKITGGAMRVDLWNAEATGAIETNRGRIGWRSYVHADRMAIVAEIEASGGETGCKWTWHALEAVSPRRLYRKEMDGFTPNPASEESADGEARVCVQKLNGGGETATAWMEGVRGGKRTLVVSVAHSFPEMTARDEALGTVRGVWATAEAALTDSHRAWWHGFYPASFVTLPDTRWESFYWIQMYKLASATRADRALIDNQGPWLQPTPWPAAWWNLNVQLSYWPTYDSNRLELGESLTRSLDKYRDNLRLNVPEAFRSDSMAIARAVPPDLRGGVSAPQKGKDTGPEIGNLPWAMHNAWLHYRHTMDDGMLRDMVFPILKGSIAYYLHFLEEGADGKLHLLTTHSPEYGCAPDCNFDLSLLRWGCGALIQACERLKMDDPMLPRWKEVLTRLTDYPTDPNGYSIGRGVPFAEGHRHFSHLLMVYPLHLVNVEQPGAFELVDRSVKHWHSLGGKQGYSFTGASSIYASFGQGDLALEKLNGLRNFIQPNTLYREAGPVIETPLSAAQCIHDMLIQSWGNSIRVFPAAPAAWRNVAFHNLRTEGAFLVSAVRRDGRTQFVRVKSLAGEPCRLRLDLASPVRAAGAGAGAMRTAGDGAIELTLAKGEEALLYSGDKPEAAVAPVTPETKWLNPYGLKANLGDYTFALNPPVAGRYVRVELPGENRILSLAEVMVFSGGKNVARGGRASQSSEANGGKAERAIDGNTDGEWKHQSVTHTKEATANPWWEADLGRVAPIERVAIWNRSILKERLDGFQLVILDGGRKEVWRGKGTD